MDETSTDTTEARNQYLALLRARIDEPTPSASRFIPQSGTASPHHSRHRHRRMDVHRTKPWTSTTTEGEAENEPPADNVSPADESPSSTANVNHRAQDLIRQSHAVNDSESNTVQGITNAQSHSRDQDQSTANQDQETHDDAVTENGRRTEQLIRQYNDSVVSHDDAHDSIISAPSQAFEQPNADSDSNDLAQPGAIPPPLVRRPAMSTVESGKAGVGAVQGATGTEPPNYSSLIRRRSSQAGLPGEGTDATQSDWSFPSASDSSDAKESAALTEAANTLMRAGELITRTFEQTKEIAIISD